MRQEPGAIQAVVFDVDGVVIPGHRFAAYLEREHGLTPAHTQDFFRGPFVKCLVGQADLATAIAPFLPSWGWQGSVDAFIERWMIEDGEADPRLLAIVSALRRSGIACYLATNQEQQRSTYLRTTLGFGQLFNGMFVSAALGCRKPEAEFYAKVCTALQLPGETILFWDDLPANVAAAQAAGWQAALYTSFAAFEASIFARWPDL